MGLAKDDDVIEAIPADRADQSLRMPVLPGRPRGDRVIPYTHGCKMLRDRLAVAPVAVPDHMVGCFIPREGICELTGDPVCCRMVGEMLKLGYEIAQSTAAKYMAKHPTGAGQTWKTFLHDHTAGIGAMDFLVVPTIGFRQLFVPVILRVERRRLLSVGAPTIRPPSGSPNRSQMPSLGTKHPNISFETITLPMVMLLPVGSPHGHS